MLKVLNSFENIILRNNVRYNIKYLQQIKLKLS